MSRSKKIGEFLLICDVCKAIGIDHKTYRRYEGDLFPVAKRLPNGYRIFTEEDLEKLKLLWEKRKERRTYYFHKTGDYYSTSEVGKILNINPGTYIYHEGKLFQKAKRNERGFRIFTKEDIEEIKRLWKEKKLRANNS